MTTYNFRSFFKRNGTEITHDDEFVSNNHFLIRKYLLTKPQNNFINKHPQNKERIQVIKKNVKEYLNIESKKNVFGEPIRHLSEFFLDKEGGDISEFAPHLFYKGENEDTGEDVEWLFDDVMVGIDKYYYNFIIKSKCKIFKSNTNSLEPMTIYDKKWNVAGIVMPVKSEDSNTTPTMPYSEYLQIQDIKKRKRKESMRKCLYFTGKKAMIKNKSLKCVAEIVGDNKYTNLYIENDKKKSAEIFIDLGKIFMQIGIKVENKDDANKIKERLLPFVGLAIDDYKKIVEDYEKAIEDKTSNMQQMNPIKIKLMELAGYPAEYIQMLSESNKRNE